MVGAYYQVPNLRIRGYEVVTNKSPQGAYRAPGAVQGTYAIESAIEELARKLDVDPIELRLKNVSMPGDPLPNGAKWAHMGLKQVLEALQDHPAWKNRTKDPNVGYGVAVGGWMGGAGPGAATTRLESDGTLSVILGSVDVSGTNTGIALIAAEAFGIPFEKVRVVNADSDTAPFSGMAGGSKITLTIGSAVSDASADARRQVLAIAADQLEASPEDLEHRERPRRGSRSTRAHDQPQQTGQHDNVHVGQIPTGARPRYRRNYRPKPRDRRSSGHGARGPRYQSSACHQLRRCAGRG